MRALMELVEMGALVVRTRDLEAKLDADALRALRKAAILRAADDGVHTELSPPDFMRALRALYGIEARGLPVPGVFDRSFQCIGWIRDEGGDRDVFLVPNRRSIARTTGPGAGCTSRCSRRRSPRSAGAWPSAARR